MPISQALPTAHGRQRAKVFLGETMAQVRFLILERSMQPKDSLPNQGKEPLKKPKVALQTTPAPLPLTLLRPKQGRVWEQERGGILCSTSALAYTAKGLYSFQKGDPGQKFNVLFWWDSKLKKKIKFFFKCRWGLKHQAKETLFPICCSLIRFYYNKLTRKDWILLLWAYNHLFCP